VEHSRIDSAKAMGRKTKTGRATVETEIESATVKIG